MTPSTFAELHLSEDSLRPLGRAGFEQPTPIQARAIPPALAERDVVGVAATGTGKTAAFLLPILERLALHPRHGPRALVLAPTRELAVQIQEQLERFAGSRRVCGALVIGGVGMAAQAQALRESTVIVATPGRLVDQLQQGTARLDGMEVLVLDEADRMFDMGFRPQLTRILARVPTSRQTLFFSATVGDEVSALARSHLRDPVRVEVTRTGTTAPRAIQHVFLPGQHEKIALLLALLDDDELSTLVFTRTKRRADKVAKILQRAGHKVARIHADRSQAQRRTALEVFRDGQYRILVATDIAARGIDVAEIGHVVNFDLPHVAEDYVHRVGRTARASASGRASSLVIWRLASQASRTGGWGLGARALPASRCPLPRAGPPAVDKPRVRRPYRVWSRRLARLLRGERSEPRPALCGKAQIGGTSSGRISRWESTGPPVGRILVRASDGATLVSPAAAPLDPSAAGFIRRMRPSSTWYRNHPTSHGSGLSGLRPVTIS